MQPYPLPAQLDSSGAEPLRQALVARIADGQPLRLDGSDVTRVGLACLQVLASAQAAARGAGLPFALEPRSDALSEMIALARFDVILDPAA